jgi:hypothetical protein
MSKPSTIPPLTTDAEAEAFLGQDLSGLDVSAFKSVRFDVASNSRGTGCEPAHAGRGGGVAAAPSNSGAGGRAMPYMTRHDDWSGVMCHG